jgi:hypothetical protein
LEETRIIKYVLAGIVNIICIVADVDGSHATKARKAEVIFHSVREEYCL